MRPTTLGMIASVIVLSGNGGVRASDSVRILATLRGELPGDHLGRSMAGVGDVNGDGLADFLVGDARGQYGTHPGQRRCHLYLGKAHLSSTPDLVIEQPEVFSYEGRIYDDLFGAVVDGGKDINGDGLDDFVITSPYWFWATGKVYLYYGGEVTRDDSPAVAIAGYGSSWMTVFWATGLRGVLVADVNGDGYDELVCLVSGGTLDAGAYLYYGGAPMDSVHDLGLQGPGDPYGALGSSLASGDLNDDEYADVVVGSYSADPNSTDPDVAWVLLGGPVPKPFPALRLEGAHSEEVMYTVCIPGDMNGDGYYDVVVADWWGLGRSSPAWCRFFLGGEPMDSVAIVEFTGQVSWGILSLAGGDLNNDGFADLIVAESSCNPDAQQGRLAIYLGGAETDTIPDVEVFEPGGYFGETVAWIGDMTGDGWPEFAVPNPEADDGRGEIYIYTMGPASARPTEMAAAMTLRISPNPAVGQALVSFVLSRPERIRLGAYDAGGRRAGVVCDGQFTKGSHTIRWDTRGVSSGVYLIRLEAETGIVSRRIVVGR